MTALLTSLTVDEGHPEGTDIGISSFMDTWLVLRNIEGNGERNRVLNVLNPYRAKSLAPATARRHGIGIEDSGLGSEAIQLRASLESLATAAHE